MSNECWVCNGSEPKMFSKKCEAHDVCDACGVKRANVGGISWGTLTGFICQKCKDAKCQKAISDFEKEEHDDFDFQDNDYVKCPHCGYEYTPGPEGLHKSTDEEKCPNCNSYIKVEVECSVMYSTR